LGLYYALIVTCGKKLTTTKRLNTRLQAACTRQFCKGDKAYTYT